ncbi:pre-mRNA-splicing factor CDC5/CEF1 [Rhodotorula toruloides]|uniref:Pre-mRNA-splicing factor CEF1 n=1 Tax=Rhodotorula toruloides TaxID=5286 RepID=A0A511KC71_RHOTO|nr:pre-mRNA-splicing factor CDC5/CEF1 [Rhodotorula toruloides]
MRVVIKGGVWKNTEDEILKAAISKYGKNQWARISSLLVRKTPKQCKARWTEWLDPAIKKTEWSKEEDEKLLHLAKLMPTQWRTIAPIVGRTANQCLERYQKLLDEAERAENEELGLAGVDDAGPSADDVRRLRPGEIDPDPENRPARPDPIDMDEDEKEMLSEARARLANTQGKKAKRKARERQLEEARRLAILQKKRELKAAGILMRAKPKKNGMDYNADIPFEKQPAAGFYDTSEEQAKRIAAPTGKTLRELEGHNRKKDREEAESREKKRKAREAKDANADAMSHFVPTKDALLQQRREEQQISKRRKLALPAPQVGERELEDLVKIGRAGESARAMVDESGNEASQGLLGEYSALANAKDARTPRTAPQHDNVMAEARNLRNLTAQQTPLLGEENTPMRELVGRTGFEGATPRGQVAATPNPLGTPFRAGQADVSATPASSVGATPLRTPARDSLSINDENASMYGATPRDQRHYLNDVKRQLRSGFSSLPQPKNEFELVLPEEEEEAAAVEAASAEVAEAMRIEDRAEREARLKELRDMEEKKELERRSQAVKRGLPRPIEVDAAAMLAQLELESTDAHAPEQDKWRREAERAVTIEMIRLLEHDSIVYPVAGSKRPGGGKSALPRFADEELAAARKTVHDAIAQAVGLPGASEKVLRRTVALSPEEFDKAWRPSYERLAYDARTDRYVDKESLSDADRIAGFRALIESNRDKMASESAKAAKAEKRLGQLLGGYVSRSKTLAGKLTENYEDLARTRIELESFARLATNEDGAIVRRTEALRDEVEKLERKERDGQLRFKELLDLKERLEAEVQEMEYAEAERINEQALAMEE